MNDVRSASVTTITEVTGIDIKADRFLDFVRDQQLWPVMYRAVVRRRRQAEEEAILNRLDVKSRLARWLLELAAEVGEQSPDGVGDPHVLLTARLRGTDRGVARSGGYRVEEVSRAGPAHYRAPATRSPRSRFSAYDRTWCPVDSHPSLCNIPQRRMTCFTLARLRRRPVTLQVVGALCIVIALSGGGFKYLGAEIPRLTSKKIAALFVAGLLSLMLGLFAEKSPTASSGERTASSRT